MILTLAGGCGEHGRNCFLLEGEEWNLMVDCGMKAGDADPMPHLTCEQITRTRFVLLTHSHKDHTGAALWLLEQGFTGTFVMTAETARQLPFTLPKARLLPTPEKPDTFHLDAAKVDYGMSGHCTGAVWFRVKWEDKRVLFSGDYNFYSDVYEHHPIIDCKADAAILDSCYPADAWSREAFTEALRDAIAHAKHVLLPVPKYGRGLDILLLLSRAFPETEVTLDSHLQSELNHVKSIRKWLRPDAYQALKAWKPARGLSEHHVLLFSDPQLESPVGRMVASVYAQEHYPILLSGSVDDGTLAKTLLERGQASLQILPVHNSDEEYELTKRANRFKAAIPVHTPRRNHSSEVVL